MGKYSYLSEEAEDEGIISESSSKYAHLSETKTDAQVSKYAHLSQEDKMPTATGGVTFLDEKPVETPKGTGDIQPIDAQAGIDKFLRRGESSVHGTPDDVLTEGKPRTMSDWVRNEVGKRAEILGQTTATAFDKGAMAGPAKLLDFWPSAYRGVKELVGLEDFNIPVVDSVARFTGGISKGQQQEAEEFITELKDGGYVKQAATIKTIGAVNDTLMFLNEIKKLGLKYGGGAVKQAGNTKRVLGVLKHAQKIALFQAMTAEDVTMKERADIWKVSSLYMSTPAISGLFKNPAAVKAFDLALNSLVARQRRVDIKTSSPPTWMALIRLWSFRIH